MTIPTNMQEIQEKEFDVLIEHVGHALSLRVSVVASHKFPPNNDAQRLCKEKLRLLLACNDCKRDLLVRRTFQWTIREED